MSIALVQDAGEFCICSKHKEFEEGCVVCAKAKREKMGSEPEEIGHYIFRRETHEDDNMCIKYRVAYPYGLGPLS